MVRLPLSKVVAFCLMLIMSELHGAEPARRFIAADSSKSRVAIVGADGKTEWEHKIGPLHDLHVLPNGNVLLQITWTEVLEINPQNDEVVWRYDAAKRAENKGQRLAIHAFQRLADGTTMVAESGPGNIIELDSEAKLLRSMAMKVRQPDPHRDTRLVRKLASGNYHRTGRRHGSFRFLCLIANRRAGMASKRLAINASLPFGFRAAIH